MASQDYLERDEDLFGPLTPTQQLKVERLLTSFAIEDMVPERFHTEAVVDLVTGVIDGDGFAARVATAREASRDIGQP